MGDGAINVAQIETQVDPRAEWAQIYRETWRIQREYFYDAKMHGPIGKQSMRSIGLSWPMWATELTWAISSPRSAAN